MNITGKAMIFRKDFDGKPSYSIGISKKVEDKYESAFMPVNFRKGVEVANKTKVDIKKAWPSWYQGKNGKVVTIFVDEFDTEDGYATVDASDIPF